MSLAVLADERIAWRPTSFGYNLWNCAVSFRFPIAKLADYTTQREVLDSSTNPFATVVLAHLSAQETQGNAPMRAQAKLRLTRRLYRLGFGRQAVLDLYTFIDWVLHLPADLEDQVWAAIKGFEEEQGMTYITTAERKGRTDGRIEELQRAILRTLRVRFGADAASNVASRLSPLSLETLDQLAEAALTAETIELFVAQLSSAAGTGSPPA